MAKVRPGPPPSPPCSTSWDAPDEAEHWRARAAARYEEFARRHPEAFASSVSSCVAPGGHAASGCWVHLERQRPPSPRHWTEALACELPAESGVPLSRWSAPELAAEVVARGIVEAVSASTVRRLLAQDALKPWQQRSWIVPRDPDFAAKAARAASPCPLTGRASVSVR